MAIAPAGGWRPEDSTAQRVDWLAGRADSRHGRRQWRHTRLGHPAGARRRMALEPLDVGLGTEPRALAFRERDVARDVALDGLLEGRRAVEDGPGLGVADRRERGQRRIEPLPEGARLVDETGLELAPRPGRDPPPVLGRLEPQADPGDGPRVAARAPAAGRRRAARRSRARAPRASGCAGRPSPPGSVPGGAAGRRAPRARPARDRPRGAPGPPGRAAGRRCPDRGRRPAGRARCRRPGSRRRPGRRSR